jgi:hypothetical protein
MKVPFNKVATQHSMHPTELLLYFVPICGRLEDFWPNIDENWLETLKELYSDTFESGPLGTVPKPIRSGAKVKIGTESRKVLDKLCRQRFWGQKTVSRDTLRNHYCRQIDELDAAVEELVEHDLLLQHDKRGTYSLNPACKGEIDRIVAELRENRDNI